MPKLPITKIMPIMRLRTLLSPLLLIAVAALGINTVDACTRVVYQGPNGTIITARSMDWNEDMGTNLWILPSGMERSGEVGPNSLKWTSKFGSVIATAYDSASTDGMNEKGLVANLLWLAESEYGVWDQKKSGLSISAWVQYVLDSYSTVDEAAPCANMTCYTYSCAQATVPTHCTAAERTFISAKMQKVHTSKGGITYSPTGKVLSICINSQGQAITQMTYRYGVLGNVEFEQSASTVSKFAIFTRSTSPHTGENIISFNKGSFRYYVTDALGQGSGVSLVVFGSGKKITDLFSGTDEGTDFYSLRDEFDFDAIKSPVLVKKAPVDDLK